MSHKYHNPQSFQYQFRRIDQKEDDLPFINAPFQNIFVLLNFWTLNKVQSCYQQINVNISYIQQLKMFRITNQFTELVSQLREKTLYSNIFLQQSSKFDLATYKINNISSQSMLKIYENIWKKYKITKELSENENSWHQNQRRVFVWFIICYTHKMEKQEKIKHQQIIQDESFWKQLSQVFFNKNPDLLQFQYLSMTKTKKRENWTTEEDRYLVQAFKNQEEGRWNEISKRMYYSSNKQCFRAPKQCRERWLNHLDTTKKRGDWNMTEDYTIFKYIKDNGKHWSKIIPLLHHTRTEHMIKNRYYSVISKLVNGNGMTTAEAEQAILTGLEKEMSKEMEMSSSQEKSSQKKNQSNMTIEDDDVPREEEIVQIKTPTPSHESVKVYENFPPVYYTYYMDFNSNIFINPYIPSSTFPQQNIYSLDSDASSFKLSVNSCFSTYNAEIFG